MSITALVCDDRPDVAAALVNVLSAAQPSWRVEGVHPSEVIKHYARCPVEVVLLGLRHPLATGSAALRALREYYPEAHVIVFGSPQDADTLTAAIVKGARGYLYLRPPASRSTVSLSRVLVNPGAAPGAGTAARVRLSERELQVLCAMGEGKTNGEIGRKLFLAEDTIKTHARRLFRKLGVTDRAEAVAHGFRHGFVR
jgi:DNA-binding NarL/FixJ family response regulator